MIYSVTFQGQEVQKVERVEMDPKDLDSIQTETGDVVVYADSIYEAVEKAAAKLGISMDPPRLYGVTDIAEELNWSKQRVHTYVKRGILPKPATQTGSRPAWTQLQMEEIKRRYKKS